MRKWIVALLAVVLVVPAFAETDYIALPKIQRLKKGTESLINPRVSDTLHVDTIAEETTGSGVTIDGLLIQDGSTAGIAALNTATGSLNTAVTALNTATGSLNTAVGALNTATGSLHTALQYLADGINIVQTPVSDTTNTVNIRFADVYNGSITGARVFPFWFSTYAVTTVATTNGVASFNLTKGSIRRYDFADNRTTNEINMYLGETDADGTFIMTITADTGPWTNRIHAYSANGSYSNLPVVFLAP